MPILFFVVSILVGATAGYDMKKCPEPIIIQEEAIRAHGEGMEPSPQYKPTPGLTKKFKKPKRHCGPHGLEVVK